MWLECPALTDRTRVPALKEVPAVTYQHPPIALMLKVRPMTQKQLLWWRIPHAWLEELPVGS